MYELDYTPEAETSLGFKGIDHIALAVRDLEETLTFFTEVLGFKLNQRRRIAGEKSGMISAEVQYHDIKFVICQGTEPASQVSRLIEHHGPGVAHIALAVSNAEDVMKNLESKGMQFDTSLIRGPGLTQVFSSRDINSGLSFEFIERNGEAGFLEGNVNDLFLQLEKNDKF